MDYTPRQEPTYFTPPGSVMKGAPAPNAGDRLGVWADQPRSELPTRWWCCDVEVTGYSDDERLLLAKGQTGLWAFELRENGEYWTADESEQRPPAKKNDGFVEGFIGPVGG